MKRYFNTYCLKSSLIIAFFLSLPLYLIHFGIDNKLLNTILVIAGLYLFYKASLNTYPLIGFFTSIFWLWWISLSFRYYGLSYLIPFIIISIGILYGFIFWVLSFVRLKILIILFFIFGFKYVSIFGFDWFRYEVLLPHTYLFPPHKPINSPTLSIKAIQTKIPQNKKWLTSYIPTEINNNFQKINEAIKNKYDVVVLPETAFPLAINQYPFLKHKLQKLSKKIAIITGALSYQNGRYYNSSYLFWNNKIQIFNKHILVPFGEKIPFNCCKKILNKIFFNGAKDYIPAPDFSTFTIKNTTFTNAICYEVTCKKLYLKKPKYIIAISDNAWFYPSIEETLQKLIVEYYSIKYHKFVIHSKNY